MLTTTTPTKDTRDGGSPYMNFTHQQHRLGKLTLHVVATLQHRQWFVPLVKCSDVLHYAEIMLTLAAS